MDAIAKTRLDSPSIYSDYPIEKPPPKPDDATRFVCISDTHNVQGEQRIEIPPGDVLIHSGDLTYGGTLEELRETYEWLTSLPHPHKVVICGNHDFSLDASFDATRSSWFRHRGHGSGRALPIFEKAELQRWLHSKDFHFLLDSECTIEVKGRMLKFYGSPWTPKFGGTAFAYPITQQTALHKTNQSIYDKIPSDVDVLLTHGPAYKILDRTWRGDRPGCPILLNVLQERIQPFLMVHGHIHEAAGTTTMLRRGGKATTIVNAAILNVRYEGVNKPVIVDVKAQSGEGYEHTI